MGEGALCLLSNSSIFSPFSHRTIQGNTGTQICIQIVVADTVSSRFRGLSIGLLSLPYIINFGVAPLISSSLLNGVGWRWGPGIFSIIAPVATAPIIISLALSQRQARKTGLATSRNPYLRQRPLTALKNFIIDVDLVGLLLICAGWLLFLLPLNLAKSSPSGWQTAHIIAMLVVGGVCLVGTGLWETFVAPKPVLRRGFVLNKDVVLPGLIGKHRLASIRGKLRELVLTPTPIPLLVQLRSGLQDSSISLVSTPLGLSSTSGRPSLTTTLTSRLATSPTHKVYV